MPPKYRPYIPQDLGELLDLVGSMVLGSPKFLDKTGYFPEKNINTVFSALYEGLEATRSQLGEERYQKFFEMAKQMRAHFEADPEDNTGEAQKGRELLFDMEDMIRPPPSKS